MKVLHVYRHDNPRLAKYVSLLSQAMPADVECAFADNASDVRLGIKDFCPDIIHQHGRFAAVWAEGRDCPHKTPRLIVSPHLQRAGPTPRYPATWREHCWWKKDYSQVSAQIIRINLSNL